MAPVLRAFDRNPVGLSLARQELLYRWIPAQIRATLLPEEFTGQAFALWGGPLWSFERMGFLPLLDLRYPPPDNVA